MNFEAIWTSIKEFFTNNVWNIVLFFGILVVGIIFVKIFLNMTKRLLSKSKMEKIAQNFVFGIFKICLYLVLILILLSIIGVQITGIITALSALLLAVGMALQNNISNVANGIIIVSTKMFKKGDYISVDGVEGSITEINFLFTTLMTTDNKKITLPNSTIVNNSVVNAGANDKRRVDVTFSVAYESDIEKVKKVVIEVLKSDGRIYLDPAPFCRLKKMNASSLDFFCNCWVDTEDYWDVYYFIMETVYNEFKRNNISIPYDQLEVRQRIDEVVMPVIEAELPPRVEKIRAKKKEHFDLETVDITKIFHAKGGNKKDKPAKKQKAKKQQQVDNQEMPEKKEDLTMSTTTDNANDKNS